MPQQRHKVIITCARCDSGGESREEGPDLFRLDPRVECNCPDAGLIKTKGKALGVLGVGVHPFAAVHEGVLLNQEGERLAALEASIEGRLEIFLELPDGGIGQFVETESSKDLG